MRTSGLASDLKVSVRDRAPASRRLLSRPWKADPFLNEIAETVIMDSNSIFQRIQHSHDLRDMYAENVQSYVDGPSRTPRDSVLRSTATNLGQSHLQWLS